MGINILAFISIFVFSLVGVWGDTPSVQFALKHAEIDLLKAEILPYVMSHLGTIHIPNIHTSKSIFDIDVKDIWARISDIGSKNIELIFTEGNGNIGVRVRDVGGTGHADIRASTWILHKSMEADIGIHGAGADMTLILGENKGFPTLTLSGFKVYIGSSNVDINIHGDIIDDILGWIVDLLKGKIIDGVKNAINSQVPPAINVEINKILASIPHEIELGNFTIKYDLPSAPVTHNTYMTMPFAAYLYIHNRTVPPVENPPVLPKTDPTDSHGVQFFISDYLIQGAIATFYAAGVLQYNITTNIFGLPFILGCKADNPPDVEFNDSITVKIKGACDAELDQGEGGKLILGIDMELDFNFLEDVAEDKLYFQIGEMVLTHFNMHVDNQSSPEWDWFKTAFNVFLEDLRTSYNQQMGNKGIPLPTFQGINLTDSDQTAKEHYLEIISTPKIVLLQNPSLLHDS